MSELFGNTQERRWYIVQTYSGYENKVKANLEQRIATMGMEDRIFRVLVPVEEKVYVKDGKTKRIRRKVFPSYVLVEMILEDQSWYVVRHTPGVTGFVGSGNHPIPLTPREVEDIMNKIGKESKPKIEVDFRVGDMIQVKSGPFAGQAGPVAEIDTDKGKIKFSVTVFGRETVVEADYTELERI
ncbi:MAG: transcription termination/antitermination protein NusG [Synergistaceae bacterium]|nr:transcription termination/antitermination protein NusG [Synergistaceae bacterium]